MTHDLCFVYSYEFYGVTYRGSINTLVLIIALVFCMGYGVNIQRKYDTCINNTQHTGIDCTSVLCGIQVY